MDHFNFFELGLHWSILNFLIFVLALYFFLRRPLKKFWEERRIEKERSFEESRKLYKETLAAYEAIRVRLTRIEEEKAELIQALREEGDLEKHKIIEKADYFARKIKEEAQKTAEQEVRKAREDLKKEIANLSIQIALDAVRKNLKAEDHKRLTEESLHQMEGGL